MSLIQFEWKGLALNNASDKIMFWIGMPHNYGVTFSIYMRVEQHVLFHIYEIKIHLCSSHQGAQLWKIWTIPWMNTYFYFSVN